MDDVVRPRIKFCRQNLILVVDHAPEMPEDESPSSVVRNKGRVDLSVW